MRPENEAKLVASFLCSCVTSVAPSVGFLLLLPIYLKAWCIVHSEMASIIPCLYWYDGGCKQLLEPLIHSKLSSAVVYCSEERGESKSKALFTF